MTKHVVERQVLDAVQIYAEILADLFLGLRIISDLQIVK